MRPITKLSAVFIPVAAIFVASIMRLLIFTPKLPEQPRAGLPVVGVLTNGGRLVIPMDEGDTIGSVYICMDAVHKLGGGTCEISRGSIKTGRTKILMRRYSDVGLALKR